MIQALTLILVCELVGELAVLVTGLPTPGPVLGMLLLLVWLFLRGGVPDDLDRTSSALLGNLSLLFVPAGVGVMVHWDAIRDGWLTLTVALLGSTLITLAVTAMVMLGVQRLLGLGGKEQDGE